MKGLEHYFDVNLKLTFLSRESGFISHLQCVVKLKEAVMNETTESCSCHLANLCKRKAKEDNVSQNDKIKRFSLDDTTELGTMEKKSEDISDQFFFN